MNKAIRILLPSTIVLILIRILLPSLLLLAVNVRLQSVPGYNSKVTALKLNFSHASYQLIGIKVNKVNGQKQIPVFRAEKINIVFDWSKLLHGKIIPQVTLYKPVMNQQFLYQQEWRPLVAAIFPFKISYTKP